MDERVYSPGQAYMGMPEQPLYSPGGLGTPSVDISRPPPPFYPTNNTHLSPSAAVFQPGGAAAGGGGRGQGVQAPHHSHLSPMSLNTVNRSAPPPRLGLNPKAPSFNTFRPPSLSPGGLMPPKAMNEQQQSYAPMTGQLSPNLSVFSSPSPGAIPSNPSAGGPFPQNWNLANPVSAGNGRGGNRRAGRGGLPVNQPLKTTGHNSKPSVSLNPAALSMMLASQKPKRKVMVRLPRECAEVGEEGGELEQDCIIERGEGENEEEDAAIEEQQKRVQHVRQRWIKRMPAEGVDVNGQSVFMAAGDVFSCPVYPEQEVLDGLPEFIDIFLPGRDSWQELKQFFLQERVEREEAKGLKEYQQPSPPNAPPTDGNDARDSRLHSFEILPLYDNEDHLAPLTSLTPSRMRKVNESNPSPSRARQHNQTVSLSMPSSGQPFGPSALTALGLPSPAGEMERSYSDSEDKQEPALGRRPTLERGHSDRQTSHQAAHADPTSSFWKDLGRGFGYDIEEEAEEEGRPDPKDPPTSLPGRGEEEAADGVQPSPSQDGDESEQSDREQDAGRGGWQDQRRRISGDNSDDSDNYSDDDLTDSKSQSEEYSNPSDEEAAREARMDRRAIRAERRAARTIEQERTASQHLPQGRPRSDTADTFASSAIVPSEGVDHSRRFSINARGPLDDGPTEEVVDQSDNRLRPSSGPFLFQPPPDMAPRTTRLQADAPAFAPREEQTTSHFRLPSIKTSSFGSSFSNSHGARNGLNAAAPSFTPGAFTFTAPGGAPKLPALSKGSLSGGGDDDITVLARESQGREKRQRHRDEGGVGGQEMQSSPPRLQPSAASIEGPLRDQTVNARLPPFNGQHSAFSPGSSRLHVSQGQFAFKPTAAPFYPTLERGQSSRPLIPAFDQDPVAEGSGRAGGYGEREGESLFGQMHRSGSGRSEAGKRTPLAAEWQQQSSGPVATSVLDRYGKIQMVSDGEESDVGEEEGDDDTVSDIIEELGDRMDKALEGWAGKILDEVTIMGQVRPVNMVTLDQSEKKHLVEMIAGQIQLAIDTHYRRLNDSLEEINARQTSLLESRLTGDDSSLTVTSLSKPNRSVGHPTLDAQGELDFDFVQDTLDQKISSLQQGLSATFHSSLPLAMESVASKARAAVEAGRMDAILSSLEQYNARLRADDAPSGVSEAQRGETTAMGLSMESMDALTSLLIDRMEPVWQEANESNTRHRRAELTDVLEPMLEEHLARSQAKGQADRQDVVHSIKAALADVLDSRLAAMQTSLDEMNEGARDEMQTRLVQSILPHLEGMRADQLEADVVAARVLDTLMPAVISASQGERGMEVVRRDEEMIQSLAKSVVEQLQPQLVMGGHLTSQRLPEEDSEDDLRQRGAVSLTKDGQEDLSAVVALLEPLVERQDETRALSQKIVEGLQEMENALDELPSAVNAKLEVFLATSQSMQEQHGVIMEKLNGMEALGGDSDRVRGLEQHRDELLRQIDEARRNEMEAKAELNEARAELSASTGYTSTLKEQCTRLEARLDQAERDAIEIGNQTVELRRREQEAVESRFAAERDVVEWEAKGREWQVRLTANEEQNQLLRTHFEQIAAEVVNSRQERAREREVGAQAMAEALASRKDADEGLAAERRRAEELMVENKGLVEGARRQVDEQVERASRAEGQVVTLEKRISEQDGRISNLQQLSATQKQMAAQGGQKLSEVEKKLKEFEGKDRELMVAHTRLGEMETRLRDKEIVEARCRASQESESRLREELAINQSRFLDVERDLMMMRDTLVERETLEQAQSELSASREELALLRGHLAEFQRRETQQQQQQQQAAQAHRHSSNQSGSKPVKGNSHLLHSYGEQSPSHGSSTWASIHAPNSSNDDMDPSRPSFVDDSFESVPNLNRSMSHQSNRGPIEVNDDGWWS